LSKLIQQEQNKDGRLLEKIGDKLESFKAAIRSKFNNEATVAVPGWPAKAAKIFLEAVDNALTGHDELGLETAGDLLDYLRKIELNRATNVRGAKGTLSKGFALLVDGNAKIPGLVQRLVEKYTDTAAGIGPLALLKMMTTVEEVRPACFEDTIALIPPLLRDATTIDPDNNGARQFNAADLLKKLVDQFDPAQVLAAGDAVQELVDTIPHAIENAADHALQLQLIAVLLALTTSTTRSELYPDDEDIADAFYKLDDMATDDARMDAIEILARINANSVEGSSRVQTIVATNTDSTEPVLSFDEDAFALDKAFLSICPTELTVSITGFTAAGECTEPLSLEIDEIDDVQLTERTITITMLEEQDEPWNPSGEGQFGSISITAADTTDRSTLATFANNFRSLLRVDNAGLEDDGNDDDDDDDDGDDVASRKHGRTTTAQDDEPRKEQKTGTRGRPTRKAAAASNLRMQQQLEEEGEAELDEKGPRDYSANSIPTVAAKPKAADGAAPQSHQLKPFIKICQRCQQKGSFKTDTAGNWCTSCKKSRTCWTPRPSSAAAKRDAERKAKKRRDRTPQEKEAETKRQSAYDKERNTRKRGKRDQSAYDKERYAKRKLGRTPHEKEAYCVIAALGAGYRAVARAEYNARCKHLSHADALAELKDEAEKRDDAIGEVKIHCQAHTHGVYRKARRGGLSHAVALAEALANAAAAPDNPETRMFHEFYQKGQAGRMAVAAQDWAEAAATAAAERAEAGAEPRTVSTVDLSERLNALLENCGAGAGAAAGAMATDADTGAAKIEAPKFRLVQTNGGIPGAKHATPDIAKKPIIGRDDIHHKLVVVHRKYNAGADLDADDFNLRAMHIGKAVTLGRRKLIETVFSHEKFYLGMDPTLSRSHAQITYGIHNGQTTITSLSDNGTFVAPRGGTDMVKIPKGEPTTLQDGSLIAFGAQPGVSTLKSHTEAQFAVRFEAVSVKRKKDHKGDCGDDEGDDGDDKGVDGYDKGDDGGDVHCPQLAGLGPDQPSIGAGVARRVRAALEERGLEGMTPTSPPHNYGYSSRGTIEIPMALHEHVPGSAVSPGAQAIVNALDEVNSETKPKYIQKLATRRGELMVYISLGRPHSVLLASQFVVVNAKDGRTLFAKIPDGTPVAVLEEACACLCHTHGCDTAMMCGPGRDGAVHAGNAFYLNFQVKAGDEPLNKGEHRLETDHGATVGGVLSLIIEALELALDDMKAPPTLSVAHTTLLGLYLLVNSSRGLVGVPTLMNQSLALVGPDLFRGRKAGLDAQLRYRRLIHACYAAKPLLKTVTKPYFAQALCIKAEESLNVAAAAADHDVEPCPFLSHVANSLALMLLDIAAHNVPHL